MMRTAEEPPSPPEEAVFQKKSYFEEEARCDRCVCSGPCVITL